MHWDDLPYFLAVVRGGTLAGAAKRLGVDATTVGRRIDRLTASLDAELFEVGPAGHSLTAAGERLLRHAEEMERVAQQADQAVSGERARLAGRVRISLSEGLATWVVGPAVPALHQRHPGIALDVVTGNGFLSPTKREADLAVVLARPTRGPLRVRKLTDYGLGLYGSRAYIAAHGSPADVGAIAEHVLVGYTPDFIYADELRYLPEIGADLEPGFSSSSITLQYRMIASGVGIGVLPHFIGLQDRELVPILPGTVEIRRNFWLAVHNDLARIARVEAVVAWLTETVTGCPRLFRPSAC